MYTRAKELQIGEVLDPERPCLDFLLAIEKHAPSLASIYNIKVDDAENKEELLFEAIEKFRHYIRLHDIGKSKSSASHSAFSTSEASYSGRKPSNDPDRKPSFRCNRSRTPKCICGTNHYFPQCLYLNEEKRPSDWKPDSAIQKTVEEKMKDKTIKEKVERAFANQKKYEEQKEQKKQKGSDEKGSPSPPDLGTFTVIPCSFTAAEFKLRSTWIFDNGSAIHVCNKTMAHRFIKERKCTDGSALMSGNGLVPVTYYGKIVINVDTPKGKGTMTLANVSYAPEFMTNVVSGSILEDKGFHFDGQNRRLQSKGQTKVLVKRIGGHYALENNTESSEASTATIIVFRHYQGRQHTGLASASCSCRK